MSAADVAIGAISQVYKGWQSDDLDHDLAEEGSLLLLELLLALEEAFPELNARLVEADLSARTLTARNIIDVLTKHDEAHHARQQQPGQL